MYAPMSPAMVPMAPMNPMMTPMMAPVMMAPPPVYYPPPPPPPVYYPPPPPPPPAPATIIITGNNNNNNNSGSPCQTCGKDTGNIIRKKLGIVGIAWCICLLCTTGCLFYIPLTRDSCKDTQLVCNRCQTVKGVVAANCC